MAIRTTDEVLEAVRARVGDDTSDEALSFIEDIKDTLTDYESRAKSDGIDWKQKYEQNDKEWRTKYRERFFSGVPTGGVEEPEETEEKLTFNDLFKEG